MRTDTGCSLSFHSCSSKSKVQSFRTDVGGPHEDVGDNFIRRSHELTPMNPAPPNRATLRDLGDHLGHGV